MKYCEKCGNELKEGFAFCDKCGEKVEKEKKEIKKEKEKEEKKEPVVKEKIVPPVLPKKKGKGKIVFLTILNILLLGAAITFLVLWLIKPTDDCDCKNYSNSSNNRNTVEQPKEEKKYVGKWEQNLEYKDGSKVVQRIYGMINLKSNGRFESLFYDKDDEEDTKEELSGTYTVNGTSVVLSYTQDGSKKTTTMILDDEKLCFKDEVENCLVMSSYNNKVVIQKPVTSSTIKEIDYTEYENLQKNYKDAIVVVVREGCTYCEKYESVVEEITENYTTPVYYYEYDGNIKVTGTPTTIVIKNGYVVDSIVGYMTYSVISEKLDDLDVD